MLPCHSCYICGTGRTESSKELGGLKLYGRKGKSHKQELLLGMVSKLPKELTTELLCLELPAYFSLLWCKKIYALHKVPTY